MHLKSLPNSEVELVSNRTQRAPRVDRGRIFPRWLNYSPGSSLDIKFPVRTDQVNRLRTRSVAGFGRAHRGKGRFRRGTARRVQHLGGALDSYAEAEGMVRVFITLTCPGSSEAAMEQFSAWSGYLLDTLNRWLAVSEQRYSGKTVFARLHCWELQRRGAEHLHYVCCLSPRVFYKVKKGIRAWYFEVLSRICELSGCDIFQREGGKGSWADKPSVLQLKVSEVRKTVSAYLSKYLRKNLTGKGWKSSALICPRPARLWGASRFLKRFLRDITDSQFWNIGRNGALSVVPVLRELAENFSIRFSCYVSPSGLMMRMRFFFYGNKLLEEAFKAEVEAVLLVINDPIQGIKRKELNMCRNLRKAQRINSTNQKRLAFANIYGDIVSKNLADFVNQVSLTRTEYAFLFRCMDDYDEVMESSRGGIASSPQRRKVTYSQLAIDLFK